MIFLRMVGGPYDRWEIPDDKSECPPRSHHFAGLPNGFRDESSVFSEKPEVRDAPRIQRFDYILTNTIETPAGIIALYLYWHPSAPVERYA